MKGKLLFLFVLIFLTIGFSAMAQSVARKWNEVLLEGIRNDFARPTVHARNLFHISAAMYDCWSVYDPLADPYFLGREIEGFKINFNGIQKPSNIEDARNEALSYACYRIISYRFEYSPGAVYIQNLADSLMGTLGYDISVVSTDYTSGSPSALGNYLAEQIINFGLQDGSNELFDYDNLYYSPVNPPLVVANPGSQDILDPNRWQPLAFDTFIDQSGNEISGIAPSFLSPEWGNTVPFSLTDLDLTTFTRDGEQYKVYHDPGDPAYIYPEDNSLSEDYKWGFSLVSIWSSHLDPVNGKLIDISPNSIGNIPLGDLPTTIAELQNFYNRLEGGDPSVGYTINPKTNQPYTEQIVPLGDYARVLAEFWADGPESETPPGHWFTLLNYVNDHPELIKKFKGEGDIVDDLEWDVKSYFTLGGAMHDAAISSWGIKGYYDYIRPISAIRYMADKGQSSDSTKANYSKAGIPLIEGYIETVEVGDSLAGINNENVEKVKLYAWKGPDYISDPETDVAGVGWILAENWWPYQRPTFVTPPFAGYVSGHSTYSRAAAKILSSLTGDEYFPGGVGEFIAPKNEFLVFEDGPSVDVVLQWAKYNDASDQCSLSRIWGGIHPPVDDIPGRLIGEKIGISAFEYAEEFFNGRVVLEVEDDLLSDIGIYPNPARSGVVLNIAGVNTSQLKTIQLVGLEGKVIKSESIIDLEHAINNLKFELPHEVSGIYILKLQFEDQTVSEKIIMFN